MSRWFVLVFAMLLPVQFAWSAAIGYCQHEPSRHQPTARSAHLGHHEHAHRADTKQASDGTLAPDNDCATCHAASAPLIASAVGAPSFAASPVVAIPLAPRPFTSALARAPDRPRWLRLV